MCRLGRVGRDLRLQLRTTAHINQIILITSSGARCAHEVRGRILTAMELVRLGITGEALFRLLHLVEDLAELQLGMGPVLVVPEFSVLIFKN